ncbi:tetratricopeptide repeat protein [Maribacter sp. 2304DJ31-5]|uniref:ATP-binding protein n=1 Tax=Maribacter sp. 2304DJ31-5 TaxID=3386273 RepID=UPI0039BD8639
MFTGFIAFSQLDSITFLEKKIKKLEGRPNFSIKDTNYINLLNELSWELRYYKIDTIPIIAKEVLKVCNTTNYTKGIYYALSNLAQYHLFKGNIEETIGLCREILEKSGSYNIPQLEMRIHNQMGQAYFINANYPESYQSFLLSLELAEKIDDIAIKFTMNMNMGTMFSLLGDYKEALGFYIEAQKHSNLLNDEVEKARLHSNMGFLYMKINDFESSMEFLNKCIPVFKEKRIPEWLAFAHTTMGDLYLAQKKYTEAINFYKKAKKNHEHIKDLKGEADISFGLGMAFLGLKELKLSENHLNKSLEQYRSFGLKTGIEKCNRGLYELNKRKRKITNALEYLELAEKYADSILRERNKANIALLLAKQNFEKEKENIKIINQKNALKQRRIIQWVSAAFFTLLILVFLGIRSNRREKRLNKKLEEKARFLYENQIKLNQTNKTQDKLFSIVGHDLRGPIVSLKELVILCLQEQKSGESNFKRFAPKLKIKLDHIHFTLDNLLNWGQTQMKGASLQTEKIEVRKEIESIHQLFKQDLKQKSISFENQVDKKIKVLADFNHFNIIFRNLISNAIKFTPENGKVIVEAGNGSEHTSINVQDTGLGMCPSALKQIFNTQEHYSTYGTNMEKGTGLGLLLCKEMAEKNNGTISIDSKKGEGSTFTVKLLNAI